MPNMCYIDDTYPNAPGHRNTDTSFDAAASVKPSAAKLQQMVLAELAKSPATSFELAARLNVTYASIQPRTSELSAKSAILDSGLRRKSESGRNSIVWKLPTETIEA